MFLKSFWGNSIRKKVPEKWFGNRSRNNFPEKWFGEQEQEQNTGKKFSKCGFGENVVLFPSVPQILFWGTFGEHSGTFGEDDMRAMNC